MTAPAVAAPAATVPMLELNDVSASYSTYRALFGVSLTVPANGIVALVGSNGAGKSTLARVATGLVPVSKGTIRVAGEDVTRMSAHRIAQRWGDARPRRPGRVLHLERGGEPHGVVLEARGPQGRARRPGAGL